MSMPEQQRLGYTDRLATFADYWDDTPATARQLSAIGHVSDRPPLESLEEGSRCISCSHFVSKTTSITTLEGDVNPERFDKLVVPDFHKAGCHRLQIRLPFDTPKWFVDNASPSIKSRIRLFNGARAQQESLEAQIVPHRQTGFLSLPIEIRLQIYEYLLPSVDSTTEIVQIDRDSMRITTAEALRRPRPHDPTQSSILRLCRTTHLEVLDLVFSRTTFSFASSKLLYMFLRRVGRTGRTLLRSIEVWSGQREDAITFALLSSCEALERVTLLVLRARLLPLCAPLWIVDGVASLLSLRGLHEVQYLYRGASGDEDGQEADAQLIHRQLTRRKDVHGMLTAVDGTSTL